MLNTVLERLSGLTSKYFVVSAFVPVLAFGAVNGLLWDRVYDGSSRWINAASLSRQATDLALVLAALAVVAYVLWSLNGFLRSILEGRALWHPIAAWLKKGQQAQIDRWWSEYQEARDARLEIEDAHWPDRLDACAAAGARRRPGHQAYDRSGPAADALASLRAARTESILPRPGDLEEAAELFEDVLLTNDVNARGPGAARLGDDLQALLALFQEVGDEWQSLEIARARHLQLRTGENAVAPTEFGNVAASMNGYATTRYGMDLPTFWSRLQPLLPKHAAFHSSLQDAKAQVDFLVVSLWLTAASTVFWVVALPLTTHAWNALVAVALGGPLLTVFLYRAAIQSYMAFAEMVCTAVDLYRWDLLEAMHLQKPSRLGQERELWRNLGRVLSFGHDWIDLSLDNAPREQK